jgi:hypothetical protein
VRDGTLMARKSAPGRGAEFYTAAVAVARCVGSGVVVGLNCSAGCTPQKETVRYMR